MDTIKHRTIYASYEHAWRLIRELDRLDIISISSDGVEIQDIIATIDYQRLWNLIETLERNPSAR
jgi:molybdenum-dependent DNA-binding transcriptional regulator ModE